MRHFDLLTAHAALHQDMADKAAQDSHVAIHGSPAQTAALAHERALDEFAARLLDIANNNEATPNYDAALAAAARDYELDRKHAVLQGNTTHAATTASFISTLQSIAHFATGTVLQYQLGDTDTAVADILPEVQALPEYEAANVMHSLRSQHDWAGVLLTSDSIREECEQQGIACDDAFIERVKNTRAWDRYITTCATETAQSFLVEAVGNAQQGARV